MLSPQKAADQAGVSRRTIMVAIEKMALKATRNNRNNWLITQEDLRSWIAQRDTKSIPQQDTTSDTDHHKSITIARLEEQLRASEQRADDLAHALAEERNAQRERVEELKADHQAQLDRRDADYQQAMELLREAQKKRGFLEWLGIRKGPSD